MEEPRRRVGGTRVGVDDQNISYAYKFLPHHNKTQILIYGCVNGSS